MYLHWVGLGWLLCGFGASDDQIRFAVKLIACGWTYVSWCLHSFASLSNFCWMSSTSRFVYWSYALCLSDLARCWPLRKDSYSSLRVSHCLHRSWNCLLCCWESLWQLSYVKRYAYQTMSLNQKVLHCATDLGLKALIMRWQKNDFLFPPLFVCASSLISTAHVLCRCTQ